MERTDYLNKIVAHLRAIGSDTHDIEVKSASGSLPHTTLESVCAFANGSGGTLVLGLSEHDGFTLAKGFRAQAIADSLASICTTRLTPPVRPQIDIVPFEGGEVVLATISELSPFDKPCYITTRGAYQGAFIRVWDGDRKLSPYEVDRLREERTQPHHDLEIIGEAGIEDLDQQLVKAVLERQRSLHPRIFAQMPDEKALQSLKIVAKDDMGALHPTLAALLALGTYPQEFYPRLTVTFAAYPGTDKAAGGKLKFLDSVSMAGPIPAVIEDTLIALRRNMRTGGVLVSGERVDLPDYPEEAVRELVCNALMHRDYSPIGRGSQVQVNLFSDRLEVLSPGGLYGTVTVDNIGEVGNSATRNPHLAQLLETVPYHHGYVAENRGTGMQLVMRELAAQGMPAPRIIDRLSTLSVVISRRGAVVHDAEPAPQMIAFRDPARNADRLDWRTGTAFGQNRQLTESLNAASTATSTLDYRYEPLSSADRIVNYLIEYDSSRASDIAHGTGLPRSTVAYQLKRLLEAHVIETVGNPSAHNPRRAYRLVQTNATHG